MTSEETSTTPSGRLKRLHGQGMLEKLRAEDAATYKKPRFDARNPSRLATNDFDEVDVIAELGDIGKSGLQSKRNAVKLDGYDSDSSEDNFNARADAKLREKKKEDAAAKSKDEDVNDMMADLSDDFKDGDDDEDLAVEGKKRKKQVQFMDETEIEGQVADSAPKDRISSDFSLHGNGMHEQIHQTESDEDASDEERAQLDSDMDAELGAGSKKSKAPKIDAFNMNEESKEGRFDKNGNFIRNAADPYAKHDSWLDNIKNSDIRKAREAKEKQKEERRQRQELDDAVETSELLDMLIARMRDGDTVLDTLGRLAPPKKKKSKPKRGAEQEDPNEQMDLDAQEEQERLVEKKRKESAEAVSYAADQLMNRGQDDIYETEKALLMRQYFRETNEDWKPSGDYISDLKWEFRWTEGEDEGNAHGPYDNAMMKEWQEGGFFESNVEFRVVGDKAWTRVASF